MKGVPPFREYVCTVWRLPPPTRELYSFRGIAELKHWIGQKQHLRVMHWQSTSLVLDISTHWERGQKEQSPKAYIGPLLFS